MINLFIDIDLFVPVVTFCKCAVFVLLSEIQVSFYSTPFFFIIFCSFLWNIYQKYLSAKYVSKLVWICTAYTVLKLEYETYDNCYFFTFIFPPHILFCLSKVWSMLNHRWVGRVQNQIKNTHIFRDIFGSFCCFS